MQNTDITEAAYNILCEWRDSQENNEVAYKNICKALKNDEVDLQFIIKQAFDWHELLMKALKCCRQKHVYLFTWNVTLKCLHAVTGYDYFIKLD